MQGVSAGSGKILAERYTLEREIGRGGTATVYLAFDLRHHRKVAIKVLRPDIAAYLGRARFLREIGIAARLTHPHILPLHDSGESEDLIYYVTPYVEGESLAQRLAREAPLPVETAVRIAAEVADALAYAHRAGVVHRDIKPGNILLESEHAVVADFGFARAMTEAADQAITASGLALGTPAYMSPEQATSGDVDGRTDIYALGCVLHEMLAGAPPFSGATPQATVMRHLHQPAPPLRSIRPSVPERVEATVAKALEKVPADRFASAEEFTAALVSGTGAPHRRTWRRAAPLAAVTVALLAGTALWRSSSSTPPLDPNRVVIFPVHGTAPNYKGLRDDATLALVASLNSSASLTAIDGGVPIGGQVPDAARSRRITRKEGASRYVDATLVASDSLRLLLDLHDVRDDGVSHRVLAFDRNADGWSIGVRSALELLPQLMQPGRPASLPSFAGRSPAALAEYFLGERAYRRAGFGEALEHFRRAVELDSGFARAALRGVQAATWRQRPVEAAGLVQVALRNEKALPSRELELALGMRDWLTGKADSAVTHLRAAISLDPGNPEPWMYLGETFNHLITTAASPDSQAEHAYRQVRELDSTFAPVLFHLLEFAVRRGNRREAERLLEEYRRGGPEPALLGSAELMVACVRGSLTEATLRVAVERNPGQVVDATPSLALGGLRQPACARAAWEALLAWDTTTGSAGVRHRFSAILGLHGLFVAAGRDEELRAVLVRDTLLPPSYRGQLSILAVLADTRLGSEADSFGHAQRDAYRSNPEDFVNVERWFLGTWLAHRGRAEEAMKMADDIRAHHEDGRRDSLLDASLRARAVLAKGDSTQALHLLRALTPTATTHQDLTWNPWESLGEERLLLARLLFARNDLWDALRVASGFDSPATIAYLSYLPASLDLRAQVADRLGYDGLARRFRQRLAALRVTESIENSP